jgi:hypothetical protein
MGQGEPEFWCLMAPQPGRIWAVTTLVDRTEIVDPEPIVSVTAFMRDRWIEFSDRLRGVTL